MEEMQLRPAAAEEIEQALAHALRFDGSKQFRAANDMMARIAAAHVLAQLQRAGFVIMRAPDLAGHAVPGG